MHDIPVKGTAMRVLSNKVYTWHSSQEDNKQITKWLKHFETTEDKPAFNRE